MPPRRIPGKRSSVRAFEIAKQLGITSKEALEYLKGRGIPAKLPIAPLTQEQTDILLEHF